MSARQHSVTVAERARPDAPLQSVFRRPDASASVDAALASPGRPLDADSRGFMEAKFGHDFSRVRVHTDSQAGLSARAVNAQAYTVGSDLVFGTGFYAPATWSGRQLLTHELTHVVQNDLPATSAAESRSCEREADAAAAAIATEQRLPAVTAASNAGTLSRKAAGPDGVGPDTAGLKATAAADAQAVTKILQGNTVLFPGDETQIMDIVAAWAGRPMETGTELSSLDWFIAALRNVKIEVGSFVTQNTSPFDQLFARLNAENRSQLSAWMKTRGRKFKDEQAVELASVEVSREELLDAAETIAEVTLATSTGGASLVFQVVKWLKDTLPSMYQQATSVIDTAKTLASLDINQIGQAVRPAGLAAMLEGALFGELPAVGEPPATEHAEAAVGKRPGSGLMRLFSGIMRVVRAMQTVHRKVGEGLRAVGETLDLTKKPWFAPFTMAYAAIAKSVEVASDPQAAFRDAVAGMQTAVRGFFGSVTDKVRSVSDAIKRGVEAIGNPAQLVQSIGERAVEMVLNFIVENPPQKVLKKIIEAVTRLSGAGSLVELLKREVPFAGDMIKAIAGSETVSTLVRPLEKPAAAVGDVATGLAKGAEQVVINTETRVLQGIDQLGQLSAPAGENTLKSAKPAAAPEDGTGLFAGISRRLREAGERSLKEGAKALGKTALATGGKKALAAIKGLLGPIVPFESRGEDHHLWVALEGAEPKVFVASTIKPLRDRLPAYRKEAAALEEEDSRAEALRLVKRLGDLDLKVPAAGKGEKLEQLKAEIVLTLRSLEAMLSVTTFTAPSGTLVKVTKTWTLLIYDGGWKEIDTYRALKRHLTGTHLDKHHLLEKRFLAPLNKVRAEGGDTNHPTTDTDDMAAVAAVGSPDSIKPLLKSTPAAAPLLQTPFFHLRVATGRGSISRRLQMGVSGIRNQVGEKAVESGDVTPREVFDIHRELYEELEKPTWVEAIKIYFRGLLKF